MTLTTQQINAGLKIVSLKGKYFATNHSHAMITGGHALHHEDFGYFAFADSLFPYSPAGGEKTLQSILDLGGMIDFDETTKWLKEYEVKK